MSKENFSLDPFSKIIKENVITLFGEVKNWLETKKPLFKSIDSYKDKSIFPVNIALIDDGLIANPMPCQQEDENCNLKNVPEYNFIHDTIYGILSPKQETMHGYLINHTIESVLQEFLNLDSFVKIYPIKILTVKHHLNLDNNSMLETSEYLLTKALKRIIKHNTNNRQNKISVINIACNEISCILSDEYILQDELRQTLKTLYDDDVITVISAGNHYQRFHQFGTAQPACHKFSIAVGAYDFEQSSQLKSLQSDSQRIRQTLSDLPSHKRIQPFYITAPGMPKSKILNMQKNINWVINTGEFGTSFATAYVTSLVALIQIIYLLLHKTKHALNDFYYPTFDQMLYYLYDKGNFSTTTDVIFPTSFKYPAISPLYSVKVLIDDFNRKMTVRGRLSTGQNSLVQNASSKISIRINLEDSRKYSPPYYLSESIIVESTAPLQFTGFYIDSVGVRKMYFENISNGPTSVQIINSPDFNGYHCNQTPFTQVILTAGSTTLDEDTIKHSDLEGSGE